jgi:uncharacterized protein YbdZ (MbtH family)
VVGIHIEQESDHAEEANHSLLQDFSTDEEDVILKSAEEMWTLWHRFFDRLGEGATILRRPEMSAVSNAFDDDNVQFHVLASGESGFTA